MFAILLRILLMNMLLLCAANTKVADESCDDDCMHVLCDWRMMSQRSEGVQYIVVVVLMMTLTNVRSVHSMMRVMIMMISSKCLLNRVMWVPLGMYAVSIRYL